MIVVQQFKESFLLNIRHGPTNICTDRNYESGICYGDDVWCVGLYLLLVEMHPLQNSLCAELALKHDLHD